MFRPRRRKNARPRPGTPPPAAGFGTGRRGHVLRRPLTVSAAPDEVELRVFRGGRAGLAAASLLGNRRHGPRGPAHGHICDIVSAGCVCDGGGTLTYGTRSRAAGTVEHPVRTGSHSPPGPCAQASGRRAACPRPPARRHQTAVGMSRRKTSAVRRECGIARARCARLTSPSPASPRRRHSRPQRPAPMPQQPRAGRGMPSRLLVVRT